MRCKCSRDLEGRGNHRLPFSPTIGLCPPLAGATLNCLQDNCDTCSATGKCNCMSANFCLRETRRGDLFAGRHYLLGRHDEMERLL